MSTPLTKSRPFLLSEKGREKFKTIHQSKCQTGTDSGFKVPKKKQKTKIITVNRKPLSQRTVRLRTSFCRVRMESHKEDISKIRTGFI